MLPPQNRRVKAQRPAAGCSGYVAERWPRREAHTARAMNPTATVRLSDALGKLAGDLANKTQKRRKLIGEPLSPSVRLRGYHRPLQQVEQQPLRLLRAVGWHGCLNHQQGLLNAFEGVRTGRFNKEEEGPLPLEALKALGRCVGDDDVEWSLDLYFTNYADRKRRNALSFWRLLIGLPRTPTLVRLRQETKRDSPNCRAAEVALRYIEHMTSGCEHRLTRKATIVSGSRPHAQKPSSDKFREWMPVRGHASTAVPPTSSRCVRKTVDCSR